jgi:hypothetical protein
MKRDLDKGKIEYLEQITFILMDQEFGESEEGGGSTEMFDETQSRWKANRDMEKKIKHLWNLNSKAQQEKTKLQSIVREKNEWENQKNKETFWVMDMDEGREFTIDFSKQDQ